MKIGKFNNIYIPTARFWGWLHLVIILCHTLWCIELDLQLSESPWELDVCCSRLRPKIWATYITSCSNQIAFPPGISKILSISHKCIFDFPMDSIALHGWVIAVLIFSDKSTGKANEEISLSNKPWSGKSKCRAKFQIKGYLLCTSFSIKNNVFVLVLRQGASFRGYLWARQHISDTMDSQ